MSKICGPFEPPAESPRTARMKSFDSGTVKWAFSAARSAQRSKKNNRRPFSLSNGP